MSKRKSKGDPKHDHAIQFPIDVGPGGKVERFYWPDGTLIREVSAIRDKSYWLDGSVMRDMGPTELEERRRANKLASEVEILKAQQRKSEDKKKSVAKRGRPEAKPFPKDWKPFTVNKSTVVDGEDYAKRLPESCAKMLYELGKAKGQPVDFGGKAKRTMNQYVNDRLFPKAGATAVRWVERGVYALAEGIRAELLPGDLVRISRSDE